jgi:hypothetical protein
MQRNDKATPKRKAPECNVPGCRAEPVARGLCDPHWSTHRGLADPAPEEFVAADHPEVALP